MVSDKQKEMRQKFPRNIIGRAKRIYKDGGKAKNLVGKKGTRISV